MQNNPAVRLYELTKKLRSASGNDSPASLWAQALDIPINHEAGGLPLVPIVQGIVAFLDLVNETETGIRELKFDDFYSEVFPPLKRVALVSLSNLHGRQANLTRPITEGTVMLLRVIAAEWAKKKPDPEIDDKVLKEIQAEVNNLFEAVKRAEFDVDLKGLILSLTSEIQQAIQQYRIGGPEGLKRALALIIGQTRLNIDRVYKADEGTKVWLTRFYKVAVKFSEVLKVASDTRKSIEALIPFLRFDK